MDKGLKKGILGNKTESGPSAFQISECDVRVFQRLACLQADTIRSDVA